MKKYLSSITGRALVLGGAAAVLLALFIYGILRAGPLAPIPVTVVKVESQAIRPALFGIGTVEARYTYMIGPTAAGKIKQLDVDVGDQVHANQVLGKMDPVDLDDRIAAPRAAIGAAQANVRTAAAQLFAANARKAFSETQARRYTRLLRVQATSKETLATQQQALKDAEAGSDVARANLDAAREALDNSRAILESLIAQRSNLNLIAPVNGLITARDANPGTTEVAGSPVLEMVDPKSLWVNARFDQLSTAGLRAGLPVRIVLRSRPMRPLAGHVVCAPAPCYAQRDVQVTLAHSVLAGALFCAFASSCGTAAAALRSSGARFRRAPNARPHWLDGVSGVLAGGLRPPARTLRLPRTTRLSASRLP